MTDTTVNRSASAARTSRRLRLMYLAADNKLFMAGIGLLFLVLTCVLFAPIISPYPPTAMDMGNKLVAPSLEHLMGTDKFGRDILSRVLIGGQTSLLVATGVLVLAILMGVPIGLFAGYFGGRVDALLMRFTDVFLAFPPLLLPIAITAALGPGLQNSAIAIAVSWFPWYARIMRGAVMRVRKELYIDAARTMGVSHLKIMIRHIAPNSLTPVIVQGSMDFGYAILAAASLSFLGLGARPPVVEWGLMAAEARTQFLDHWWTALFPGLAIFIAVLAVNLVGDGLRDLLDPKHGRRE